MTDDSANKIDDYELSSNSYMQQGRMVGAYSNAVENAAKNTSGSMNGFMGIGMMNMASNGVVGGAAQGPWNAQNLQNSTMDLSGEQNDPKSEGVVTSEVKKTWKCECGHENEGNAKFCNECGKPKKTSGVCAKCGKVNPEGSKFCNDCGEKL